MLADQAVQGMRAQRAHWTPAPFGDADLLGILPKNQTEPENAVSRLLHFQRLTSPKMTGHPASRGKRQ